MEEKNYVAYVGTYTHGSSKGIYIYDLDVENGQAKERKVVPINNPSYIMYFFPPVRQASRNRLPRPLRLPL